MILVGFLGHLLVFIVFILKIKFFNLGDTFKYPLTLSLIGIGETPFGIRVTIFDHMNCRETGIFYTVNERIWKKKAKEGPEKKKKKYILDNLLDENYNINFVLKAIGYVILMDSVRLREAENGVRLEGRANFNKKSMINQLENALSINNIVTSFQKNNFPV